MKPKGILVILILLIALVSSYQFLSDEEYFDCMDGSCCTVRNYQGNLTFLNNLSNMGVKTKTLWDYLIGNESFDLTKNVVIGCSVDRFNTAELENLKIFIKEREEDGMFFNNWICPSISFRSTLGDRRSIEDFRGQKIALMFIDVKYSNCLEILMDVAELKDHFEESELAIVPVCLNATTKQSSANLIKIARGLDLNYDLMLPEDQIDIAQFNSKVAPTVFLIDEQGFISQKLVGHKDIDVLKDILGRFLD